MNGSDVTIVVTILTTSAASPSLLPLVTFCVASLLYAGDSTGLSVNVSVTIGVAVSAVSAADASPPPLFINTFVAFSTMLPPASNTCSPPDLVVTLPLASFTISDSTLLCKLSPVVFLIEPAALICSSPVVAVANKFVSASKFISAFDCTVTTPPAPWPSP